MNSFIFVNEIVCHHLSHSSFIHSSTNHHYTCRSGIQTKMKEYDYEWIRGPWQRSPMVFSSDIPLLSHSNAFPCDASVFTRFPMFVCDCKYHMDFRGGDNVFEFILSLFKVPSRQYRFGFVRDIRKFAYWWYAIFIRIFHIARIDFTAEHRVESSYEHQKRSATDGKTEKYLHADGISCPCYTHYIRHFRNNYFNHNKNRFVCECVCVFGRMDDIAVHPFV